MGGGGEKREGKKGVRREGVKEGREGGEKEGGREGGGWEGWRRGREGGRDSE